MVPMRPCAALTFYVLRHGETDHNAAVIMQGSSDVPRLTAKGRRQALAVGSSALDPTTTKRIDRVYVSPLARARDTLALIRESAPPGALPPDGSEVVLPDLREIDLYSWENRPEAELEVAHPEEYAAWRAGDPDGLIIDGHLPLRELWDRAGEVWKEVRSRSPSMGDDGGAETNDKLAGSSDDDVDRRGERAKLLVCHGNLGQALLATAFGEDATVFGRNLFPNCGIAEIVWNDDEDFATSWRWHHKG